MLPPPRINRQVNARQPQGVVMSINLSQVPAIGFFKTEFVEDGQLTVPSHVNVNVSGASDAIVVINDSLLRTHQDSMTFSVDNINPNGSKEVAITFYEQIMPITDAERIGIVVVKANSIGTFSFSKVNGRFICSADMTPSNTLPQPPLSGGQG